MIVSRRCFHIRIQKDGDAITYVVNSIFKDPQYTFGSACHGSLGKAWTAKLDNSPELGTAILRIHGTSAQVMALNNMGQIKLVLSCYAVDYLFDCGSRAPVKSWGILCGSLD
eukprot:3978597-Amphidinium_carterae.2